MRLRILGLCGSGFVAYTTWDLGSVLMRIRIQGIGPNPSTRLMKRTIFQTCFFGKISRPRLISIRWNFVWGKGTRFKEFFGGPILIVEISK